MSGMRYSPFYKKVPSSYVAGEAAVPGNEPGASGGPSTGKACGFRHGSATAAIALLVDAKDDGASRFYERHDFRRLTTRPQRLFLPLPTIARMIAAAAKPS